MFLTISYSQAFNRRDSHMNIAVMCKKYHEACGRTLKVVSLSRSDEDTNFLSLFNVRAKSQPCTYLPSSKTCLSTFYICTVPNRST